MSGAGAWIFAGAALLPYASYAFGWWLGGRIWPP